MTQQKLIVSSLLLQVLIGLLLHGFMGFEQIVLAKNLKNTAFQSIDALQSNPNLIRTAQGKPGSKYWQQRVDYSIKVEFDEAEKRLSGQSNITYYNNSPHPLTYLWIQLDQNRFKAQSKDQLSGSSHTYYNGDIFKGSNPKVSYEKMYALVNKSQLKAGFNIKDIIKKNGRSFNYTEYDTLLKVHLDQALQPKQSINLTIFWSHYILPDKISEGRSGYQWHKKENDGIYSFAQWFPKLCVFNDIHGWENLEFLGGGEFSLEFGNYEVSITVPEDHYVAATGTLQNPELVLSKTEQNRLKEAEFSSKPIYIVNPDEAKQNTKYKAKQTKTWIYKAENVRDFAFSSSRMFVWDAMGVTLNKTRVMAMSFYPVKANVLWHKFASQAIAHTLKVYSDMLFDYPYPKAIAVSGKARGGMEYPMITFIDEKRVAETDHTYSKQKKTSLIGVIAHEVGHNYFPMIINNNERRWAWMDEGMVSFMDGIVTQSWDKTFINPKRSFYQAALLKRLPQNKSIMTEPDNQEKGSLIYTKPAMAFSLLRETILGRQVFEQALKEYALSWKFKKPEPQDLFRIFEDVSGVDLDWFWRGWFYGTDHVDIALKQVSLLVTNKNKKNTNTLFFLDQNNYQERYISEKKAQKKFYIDAFPKLKEKFHKNSKSIKAHSNFSPSENTTLDKMIHLENTDYLYELEFENLGGMVMPIPIKFTFKNQQSQFVRIPVYIWRKNNNVAKKTFQFNWPIESIEIDPYLELFDSNRHNQIWPKKVQTKLVELQLAKKKKNPMQKNNLIKKNKGEKK